MKAMILAAGFGTRLRPITNLLPKPMVPLCNKPLIGWVADALRAAGVTELIVNVHHLSEPLEEFLRDRYRGVTIHISREEEILGTGGGVRRVRSLLEGEEDFFLVNADTVQDPPFARLRAERRSIDALAALTLRHPPENDRFTPVFLDEGRISGFGSGSGSALMFSGSHCISSRIFRYLPEKEFSGIIDEAYEPAMQQNESIAGVVDDGFWYDIGTPQRYLQATASLLQRLTSGEPIPTGSSALGDSIVASSADIRGLCERSAIGERTVIEGTVRDSAVWNDCRIGAEIVLARCVVAHGVVLDGKGPFQGAVITPAQPDVVLQEGWRIENGLLIAPFEPPQI
ncbi:MAG TPA: sugar phosphate nucleotidyltransferase [Thermoanaerobaculia bacterium]|nr:sugar phosphate nucleotidyltransferase [Thermoanaerobaculia bacterium]